ncbi:hypothetical protein DFH27DRAFT_583560 [Peziza echinospora]|nr:hypothetical protein DFH27DRAFT_583560 [Peziza echinospora]
MTVGLAACKLWKASAAAGPITAPQRVTLRRARKMMVYGWGYAAHDFRIPGPRPRKDAATPRGPATPLDPATAVLHGLLFGANDDEPYPLDVAGWLLWTCATYVRRTRPAARKDDDESITAKIDQYIQTRGVLTRDNLRDNGIVTDDRLEVALRDNGVVTEDRLEEALEGVVTAESLQSVITTANLPSHLGAAGVITTENLPSHLGAAGVITTSNIHEMLKPILNTCFKDINTNFAVVNDNIATVLSRMDSVVAASRITTPNNETPNTIPSPDASV